MNALKTPSGAEKPFIFSSTEGHALCRHILKELLPYDPHDVQIKGICKVMDNVDLFAVLATGSGETSFLSMYMPVVLAIQGDPSMCSTAKFPKKTRASWLSVPQSIWNIKWLVYLIG